MRAGGRYIQQAELIHGLCNWGGAAFGMGYAVFAILPWAQEEAKTRALSWAIGALVGSTPFVFGVITWLLWPARTVLNRLEQGLEVAEADRLRAARVVLGAPLKLAALGFLVWLLCAASIPVVFPEGDPAVRLHAMAGVVLVGFVAFTFNSYGQERLAQRRVLPALLEGRPATRVPGARSLSLAFRLGLLLVTTCVVPIVVLTLAARSNALSAGTMLFVAASFLALGAFQAASIVQLVGRPLRTLEAAIAKVEQDVLEGVQVPVLAADEVGRLGAGFNQMVEGLLRGHYVKETFGRYVTPQVVEEILSGKVALGGEERFVTVLFSDIRGFTSMSEELPPGEVVRFLNQFLDRMVDVLVRHGATIDKFIGDAVMATFGVPVSRSPEEDARAAVLAALEMQVALEAWNAERIEAGERPLSIGIGVHSGVVVAGNIGSSRKTEYTVIGDTVNTAARIESLTRHYGEGVLLSEQTRALAGDLVPMQELKPVEVRGKKQPVRVYAVRPVAARGVLAS